MYRSVHRNNLIIHRAAVRDDIDCYACRTVRPIVDGYVLGVAVETWIGVNCRLCLATKEGMAYTAARLAGLAELRAVQVRRE